MKNKPRKVKVKTAPPVKKTVKARRKLSLQEKSTKLVRKAAKIIAKSRTWKKDQTLRRKAARKASLEMIAKQDGITIAEARKKYPRSRIEVVWKRPARRQRNFLRVNDNAYLEVEAGKPAKHEYTFGKARTLTYVRKVRGLISYWNTIRLLADVRHESIAKTRHWYRRQLEKYGRKVGETVVLFDLGLYDEIVNSPKLDGEKDV